MKLTKIEDLRDPILSAVIDNLRAMYPDMQQLAGIKNYVILEHIERATLEECKFIVDSLVDRVSDLLGLAVELEDASEVLQAEIDAQNTNPPLCAECNGSGEGAHEGTSCFSCGGSGVKKEKFD